MSEALLLIEDDQAVRETLVDILEDHGLSVVAVAGVAEASATVGEFGVALVDVRLPDGNGLEVARLLRGRQPDLDVVFLTANASLDTALGAIEVGAVRYLQKPFPPGELLRVIDEIFERRALRREAARQADRVDRVARLTRRLLTSLVLEELAAIGIEEVCDATSAFGADIEYGDLRYTQGASEGEAHAVSLGEDSDEMVRIWARPEGFDLVLAQLMCAQLGASLRLARTHHELQLAHERLRANHVSAMEAERHSAFGRLAAGIAHEIGTPLNIISGRAEVLLSKAPPGAIATGLEQIGGQIDRIAGLVRQLLDFSRPVSAPHVTVSVSAVLRQILPLIDTRATSRHTAIEADVDDTCIVSGSADQLQQVFLNLLLNAVDADARHIVVHGRREGQWVELRVEDDGEGVPPEKAEAIFEPFFTTKPRGKGTGLGLAVVEGIVRDHGGTITAAAREGGGALFTVRLPASPEAALRPIQTVAE